MGFKDNAQLFLEQYGWLLLILFAIYYYVSRQYDIIPKIRDFFSNLTSSSNNTDNDISSIPTSFDDRLQNSRAQQQQRFNQMTEITDNKPQPKKKLSKKDSKIKKSSAYKYATNGDWSTRDDANGNGDERKYSHRPTGFGSSYRPPTPFKRYGRRPGGGGGGGGG